MDTLAPPVALPVVPFTERVHGYGTLTKDPAARAILDRLNELHELPAWMRGVDVVLAKPKLNYRGIYQQRSHCERDCIILSNQNTHPALRQLDLLHEIAHFIDRRAFILPPRHGLWASERFERLDACRYAIQASAAYMVLGSCDIPASARLYLSHHRELFARAWSQWAMGRLGLAMPTHLDALSTSSYLAVEHLPAERWNHRYYRSPLPEHWDAVDFAPIAAAFDELALTWAPAL